MSNLLFMDESNGNGLYASKSNNSATTNAAVATTTTANSNNINNIMTASTTAANATVTAVANMATLPTSISNEDLSQSLSEYTDADESISAPTEFLAEFLSAVMLKDYKKALKYCKLILQYEPNNATAKEFYPLILDKLRGTTLSDSDENYNKSSSPEMALELQCSDPSASGESDEAASDDQHMGIGEDGADEEENSSGEPNSHDSNMCAVHSHCDSNSSSSCDSAGVSLSESVDDDDDVEDDDDDVDVDDDVEEEEDAISSSGDDLPIDEQHGSSGADEGGGGGRLRNCSHSSRNSSSGGGGRSRSDNTTHSYSSLLLEEEDDDIVPVTLQFSRDLTAQDLDVSNGNKIPSTSCSDSESPTEPLTQRLAAILRSTCGVANKSENY